MTTTFENLGLGNDVLSAINRLGFEEPTAIQEKAIPLIVEGQDVIGESATGSGKTLAFGCGLEHVHPGAGLQALILTPTRELAEQVKDSLKKLSSQKKLRILAIYGGVAIGPQIQDLERADVAVATPGRLLDHLSRATINLRKIKLLVLDEADRMFDMGFINDVEEIIQSCPGQRQTLFFSATISPRVEDLADRYMHQPHQVSALKRVDPSKLTQVYYDVEKNMKLSLLIHLLESEKSGLIMVFCNTRRTTDFVVSNLKSHKIHAFALHGGLTQNKRTKILNTFNKSTVSVLVCTDVAARGLHIDNVSHVYNYEIPNDPTDYVHRIGRTARAGEHGKVINLLCHFDYDNFSRVCNEHRDFVISKVVTPVFKQKRIVRENRRPPLRGSGFRRSPGRQPFRRGGRRWK